MAKKIRDENGDIYVQKKPIYKHIWFWFSTFEFMLIVFLIFGIYVMINEMDEDYNILVNQYNTLQSSVNNTSESKTKQTDSNVDGPENKKHSYTLNEEAIIENKDGQPMYSLKIVKVNKGTDETSEYYTDGKPDNTLEVVYEYKNYNMDTPIKINSQFLSAYSNDGKAGKTMNMMDGQTEVAKDHSSQTRIWIVFSEPVANLSEISIGYNNDFTLGFKNSISFNINL